MNRRLVIAASIVLVIGAAGAYLALANPDMPAPTKTADPSPPAATTAPTQSQATSSPEPKAAQPGSYRAYSAQAVTSTSGTKLIFFHAPWCPQCRKLENDIKTSTIPENTTIFKVDYDTSQALRQKYGVTIQTTLVRVDDNGNLIKKYVAYDDPTLDAVVKALL